MKMKTHLSTIYELCDALQDPRLTKKKKRKPYIFFNLLGLLSICLM